VPVLLAAPDKFRGTATAREVAAAIARAATHAGWSADEAPMADGGEGVLDVLPGRLRTTKVRGPLGRPVDAEWRLDGKTAVIEMARASGLALAGGPERNRAMDATTRGTGELIAAAVAAGATRVIVGLGGSATTDGGLACIEALRPHARLASVELIGACDVTTGFVDAAETFAPQKGATQGEVRLLRRRLERLAQEYEREFGVDVTAIESAGAAGGLAGGLAALGARLVRGFDLIADAVDLGERIAACDLVVTGEGFLDAQSFDGKVVGGVLALASQVNRPTLVLVGQVVDNDAVERVESAGGTVVALSERYGLERALAQPLACVEEVVADHLGSG
jgi:glycerate kinase